MKMNQTVVLILFACAPALANNSIVGGKSVSANEWIAKTVVALVSVSNQGEALCTASLVAPDLAVTAAHCVTNPGHVPVTGLGLIFNTDVKKADASSIRRIDHALVPAEWRAGGTASRNTFDVALVHFAGGLPTGYQPSDLLPRDQSFSVGEKVELAGYGITNARTNAGAGRLRKTTVAVLNPQFSATEVSFDQSQGGGACHGDSGGPAFIVKKSHPYLFGITSRGTGNCDQDVIYTKIASYWDWFHQAASLLRGKNPGIRSHSEI